MNALKKFITYLKEIMESTTKSSSKRLLALGTFMLMAATHCPVWKNGTAMDNIILIGADASLILTLLGIASYQNNIKTRVDGPKVESDIIS